MVKDKDKDKDKVRKNKQKERKNKQKERKEKEKIVCFIHLNHSVLLKKRQWQDLNLRLQWRSDFESHALDHSATLSYYPNMFEKHQPF